MVDTISRAKQLYGTFCKLNTRNTVKQRGKVVCSELTAIYSPEKAVDNFYNAMLKAEEQTALERVILVALRELSTQQRRILSTRLKQHYQDVTQTVDLV